MTIMCTGNYLVFDFFFHFQKKYKATPDRAYIPMNIYIGFTLSPRRYAMSRLKPVLNYFSSFTNDDLITFLPSSNMMVILALFPESISTIVPSPKTLCLTLSPMSKFAMISLPIRLSNKYQVKQINHEVGKKHHRESTYNNPNVHIKIIIPCKYLVIIPPCK